MLHWENMIHDRKHTAIGYLVQMINAQILEGNEHWEKKSKLQHTSQPKYNTKNNKFCISHVRSSKGERNPFTNNNWHGTLEDFNSQQDRLQSRDHLSSTGWDTAISAADDHRTPNMAQAVSQSEGKRPAWLIERFSKPNFGSIRRFRMMTGLEIETWIEKCGRTVRKFRSTRPRTELNFRFGLTSCRSQNLPTEVRSLLCQVFDSFSLVTSSSSHHAWHLRGFIRSLTRPNWNFHSTRLTMNFFTSAGDFRQVHGHQQWMNGHWRGVGYGIPSDRGLGRRTPPDSLTKNTSLGHKDRDFLQLDTRAAALGMHAIVWSIVFLFAERNFRLCVNRNFDTIFDPVLPEPNRIFGLLNLSNSTKNGQNQKICSWHWKDGNNSKLVGECYNYKTLYDNFFCEACQVISLYVW